jgi:peroxiredoxin
MSVEIGQEVPDFELKDQSGQSVRLSSFRGDKPVVLVFYPFTFTGVCEGELCQLRDDIADYDQANVQVVAVSCDSAFTQKQWAEQQNWNFPVLSDFWPHGEVARSFGVFNEKLGCANRATFVIDVDGKLVDRFESENLGTPRGKDRYEAALLKLAGPLP